eukprot:8238305-Alexandrium_andersonii.AAC.1
MVKPEGADEELEDACRGHEDLLQAGAHHVVVGGLVPLRPLGRLATWGKSKRCSLSARQQKQ